MNATEFNILLTNRLAATEAVLGSKAGEYATDNDRLHNFKLAAELQRCTPEVALLGMLTKHLVSVVDMAQATNPALSYPHAYIDEKIGDSINYLILLEAILKEYANGN